MTEEYKVKNDKDYVMIIYIQYSYYILEFELLRFNKTNKKLFIDLGKTEIDALDLVKCFDKYDVPNNCIEEFLKECK